MIKLYVKNSIMEDGCIHNWSFQCHPMDCQCVKVITEHEVLSDTMLLITSCCRLIDDIGLKMICLYQSGTNCRYVKQ